MINITLWKREWKSNVKLILLFTAVLVMYQGIILSMFDPKLGKILDELAKGMPQIMAMFGMEDSGSTLIQYIGNYLYGFIMIIFPMLFGILLAHKLVAKYVEQGSMAYLLATPNTRRSIIVTQAVELIVSTFSLFVLETAAGLVFSRLFFPGELAVNKFILLNVCAFFLLLAVGSISFFASCISNDAKYSYLIGAGIPVLFYLINMLANMGGKLEKLKYATIFTLFQPEKIIAGSGFLLSVCVLIIIAAVFYLAGIIIFERRDLPL